MHPKFYNENSWQFNKSGLTPKLHIMDNEVSEDLKKHFEHSDIYFHLVPPYMHWRNSAERAVRNFRNHFIAALCTVYPVSPSTYEINSYPKSS